MVSCDPPSTVLRHVRDMFGETVTVNALYVGADSVRAQAFLASERLPIPVSVIRTAEFNRQYGSHRLPLVIFADAGYHEILGKSAWAKRSDTRPTELESRIARLMVMTSQH